MRLTCLKCGHQIELTTADSAMRVSCVCGEDYTYPNVVNTGTRPNERAAERSRSKAFRAAGLVKNFGGFALGISLLGVLFFPVALVGAAIGVYALTMVRGPAGRYSGRREAAIAVALGALVFVGEGAIAMSWMSSRRQQRIVALQSSAGEDLRALLRTERLYRAMNDTYGSFQEFHFEPRFGLYTIYLGPDDVLPAHRNESEIVDPLPAGVSPGVSESAFTAVAVANLDKDPALDVWTLDERGELVHQADDAVLSAAPAEVPSEPEPEAPPPSSPSATPSTDAPQGALAPSDEVAKDNGGPAPAVVADEKTVPAVAENAPPAPVPAADEPAPNGDEASP